MICPDSIRKKGVSPIIAVVLMIAVTVAIAIIIYSWSSGFVSERSSPESAQAEQLIIESLHLSGTNLTVYVRNVTQIGAHVDAIYVNNELRASNMDYWLPANEVTPLDVSSIVTGQGRDGTFYSGDRVRLVTIRGTQIQFRVKQ